MEATKGRMLDHIGFEVTNLEAFCARLNRAGSNWIHPTRKINQASQERFSPTLGEPILS